MLTDKQPFDRNHMKEVLDTLLVVWSHCPTLRLGQLIANATKTNDVFYVEDTKLVKKLWEFDTRSSYE
jgi:hypothetical protein